MRKLTPRNDMRSSLSNSVVRRMRAVSSATGEFRAAKSEFEKKGTPGRISKETIKVLEKIDMAVPGLYLKHRESGSLGINSDGELVRRLHGVDAIEQKAKDAQEAVELLQGIIREEAPCIATSVRSKHIVQKAQVWKSVLKVGLFASVGAAIGAATVALGQVFGNATDVFANKDSIAMAVGGVLSAIVLRAGIRKLEMPKTPKHDENDVVDLRKSLAKVKKNLNELAGASV